MGKKYLFVAEKQGCIVYAGKHRANKVFVDIGVLCLTVYRIWGQHQNIMTLIIENLACRRAIRSCGLRSRCTSPTIRIGGPVPKTCMSSCRVARWIIVMLSCGVSINRKGGLLHALCIATRLRACHRDESPRTFRLHRLGIHVRYVALNNTSVHPHWRQNLIKVAWFFCLPQRIPWAFNSRCSSTLVRLSIERFPVTWWCMILNI